MKLRKKKVKAIELIKEGQMSIKEIGEKLKIHPITLYKWRKESRRISESSNSEQNKLILVGEVKYRLFQMKKEIDSLSEVIDKMRD